MNALWVILMKFCWVGSYRLRRLGNRLLTHRTISDQASASEDTFCLLKMREPDLGENTLGAVLDTLLPSFKEVILPTPLPTYLGPYITFLALVWLWELLNLYLLHR